MAATTGAALRGAAFFAAAFRSVVAAFFTGAFRAGAALAADLAGDFRFAAAAFRTGAAFFGVARFLAGVFGAAALRLAAAFFLAGVFAFRTARLRAGGVSATTTGAITSGGAVFRLDPDLAIPLFPLGDVSVHGNISGMRAAFQGAGTKLIAEGLPTAIVTPVDVSPPSGSPIRNTEIRSLSWLAA